MARTRISFNVGRVVHDWEIIYRYLEDANPASMLFMDHFGEALTGYERQKAANPLTEPVISYRGSSTIGQDNTYRKMTPEEVHNTARAIWGGDGNRHIWVILDNEPHANGEDQVRFMSDFYKSCLELLCNDGFKVIVGNFSAGTIDNPQWMHSFLETVSRYKDQVLLSEHMYAMVSPNFGWQHRRVPEDNTFTGMPVEQALDYLHPAYWLTKEHIKQIWDAPFEEIATWHYGRIKKFYHYAAQQGWELPQFVATEGLMDDLQDLEIVNGSPRRFEWRGNNLTLKQHIHNTWGAGEYSQIKGDMSYEAMYNAETGYYFPAVWTAVLSWADRTFPEQLHSINLFTASHAEDWTRYGHNYFTRPEIFDMMSDIAEDRPYNWVGGRDYAPEDQYYLMFEDVHIQGEDKVYPEVNINDSRWADHQTRLNDGVNVLNVRRQPNGAIFASLRENMVVEFIDTDEFDHSDGVWTWKPVVLNDSLGWVASELVTFLPVDQTPPVSDTEEYVSKQEYDATIQAIMDHITELESPTDDYVLVSKEGIDTISESLYHVNVQLGNILAVLQGVNDSVQTD